MDPGLRDQLVTVERLVTTPDEGGGQTQAWTAIGSLWVGAKWVGGGEPASQAGVQEIVRYRFTADAASVEALDLTSLDRIVWSGEVYNIRERPRRQEASSDIEIYAEAGVTQ